MSDEGYQLSQSLIAIGSGGLFGMGLGQGRQKTAYLPYPESDFIFASIAEDFGLFGCIAVIALFVLFVYAGIRVALRCPDRFGLSSGGRHHGDDRRTGVSQYGRCRRAFAHNRPAASLFQRRRHVGEHLHGRGRGAAERFKVRRNESKINIIAREPFFLRKKSSPRAPSKESRLWSV